MRLDRPVTPGPNRSLAAAAHLDLGPLSKEHKREAPRVPRLLDRRRVQFRRIFGRPVPPGGGGELGRTGRGEGLAVCRTC